MIAGVPENPCISAQLRSLIYYSLDNELLQNAVFHAGRLHGLDPRNGDATHLLALCHFRMGQYRSAYDYSREKGLRAQHLGCAYIFAQSCLTLGRFMDGIMALDRSRGYWAARNHWNKHTETSRRHLPDAAAVNYLLGKLWIGYGEPNKAVEYFVEALKLNPFMWDAFAELCQTGVKIKSSNVFKLTTEMLAADSQPSVIQTESMQILPLQPHVNGNPNGIVTPGHDPFNPKPRVMSIMHDSGVLKETLSVSDWETPNGNSIHDDDVTMDDAPFESEAPHPPRKPRQLYTYPSDFPPDLAKMRSITTRSRTKAETDGQEESSVRPTSIPVSHKRTISGQVPSATNGEAPGAPNRRSDRLLRSRILPTSRMASAVGRDIDGKERNGLRKVRATGTKGKSASTVGRIVSGNRKPLEPTDRDGKEPRPASVASITSGTIVRKIPTSTTSINDITPQREALAFLIDQYGRLGKGFLALSRYDCLEALAAFDSTLPQIRETPWTLTQIGKAHFERSAYIEAELNFAKARKMAPSRTEDMEVYSTTLWHLRKDVELAYLSHEMLEADRLSPQAWCALGNAFSIQGEHDRAVRCFRRATQLDGKFAYAFTLQGHEHVANEEFEKALLAFRSAISADGRHYNGWYGLGQVFERLGRYEVAREHYAAAGRINPANAVLKICLGWAIQKTAEEPGTNSAGQPTLLTVPQKMDRREMALECYDEAVRLDPKSTKARSYKARVLMLLHRPAEAHAELMELQDMTPNNAQVHFLLGKVNRKLKDRKAALRHFTTALSLDPKASNVIKENMESLNESDDDSEDGDWD